MALGVLGICPRDEAMEPELTFKSKSQPDIEYSYQARDRWVDTWVLWIHASSVARFEEGYWWIADRSSLLNVAKTKPRVAGIPCAENF